MKNTGSSSDKPLRYCNRKYRFTIVFPHWWRQYLIVDRVKIYRGEVYLRFLFRYGGKVYDPVFTIVISPFGEQEWRRRYEDSPLVFLRECNGHSYSYILPEELPDAFLKPDKSDYDYKRFGRQIRLLVRMVNGAPAVLKSFVCKGGD